VIDMSERLLLELYNRIVILEDRVGKLEQEKPVQETKLSAVEIKGKYRFLSDYLYSSGEDFLKLTFAQIEKTAKVALPESKKYREFWSNTESHSIALAWLNVGYRTTTVDVDEETVCFEKIRHYTPDLKQSAVEPADDLIEDVENAINSYEKANGSFAQRTRSMIRKYGLIEALSRLVMTADYQKGFKVLRDNGKQNISFEAIIVKHQDRFNKGIVEAAKFRLKNPYWTAKK
jgi:hypothetical protein